eukprot:6484167-Amphidinium_carterae.1
MGVRRLSCFLLRVLAESDPNSITGTLLDYVERGVLCGGIMRLRFEGNSWLAPSIDFDTTCSAYG